MSDAIPTTYMTIDEIGDGIPIYKLLVKCGLCKSNSEARRLIQQGGIYIYRRKNADH
jgi:tyrosyl-tRNA synthetase